MPSSDDDIEQVVERTLVTCRFMETSDVTQSEPCGGASAPQPRDPGDRYRCVHDSKPTQRSLAKDQRYSLRDFVPLPMVDAIKSIAAKEGWHAECLDQEIKACASFSENPAPRLKIRADDSQKHAPGIAVILFTCGSTPATLQQSGLWIFDPGSAENAKLAINAGWNICAHRPRITADSNFLRWGPQMVSIEESARDTNNLNKETERER